MNRQDYVSALDSLSAALTEQVRITGELDRENAKLKQALGNIANYLSEFWLSDPNEDWDNLANHLYRAGFNCVRDWNGEPEPFIHGDNAEGSAGGRARGETEGFAEGAEG